MKIGIPKALLYHKYHPLWTTFFTELGAEVVLSSDGTRQSYDSGCRHCLDEICLPIKTYFGHVIELRDKVDCIFVPRIVSVEKRRRGKSYTCPKIIGLTDMVRAAVSDLPKILSPTIDINKRSEILAYLQLGLTIARNPARTLMAYSKAKKEQENLENKKTAAINDAGMKIGVISHAYNLCGSYPTPDVLRILKKLGAVPITIDIYPKRLTKNNAEKHFPELSWNFEREMLGGSIEMLKDKEIAGCIVLSNFSCGPDSLTGDYIIRMAKRHSDVPFSLLLIDEHTGEAGLKTRIEAFTDMIKRRR